MQKLIEISRQYFLKTGDRQSRVWVFRPDQPSPFLRSSAHFGDRDFKIRIVDLFAGLQPILLNYEAFSQDELKIPFRPTVILDSNMVSYVHQYVSSSASLSSKRRNTVFEALRFIISNKLDYNPFFYYMEGAAKDVGNNLLGYAEDISLSILTLHTMNEELFLNSGKIATDPEQLAIYAKEFGAQTIEEIAPLYARAMIGPTDPWIDGLSRLFYAALLKTGLIHKKSRRDVAAKYKELQRFMQDDFNIALGIERMLALGYFAGQFDEFIPLQRGANSDRLLRRLRAAAWDLVLLQLPLHLLMSKVGGGIVLGYIGTSDRALAQIAQACKVEAVMGLGPEGDRPKPFISYDLSALEKRVGHKVVASIMSEDTNWQQSRLSNLTEHSEHISYDNLLKLITNLETEVMEFCGA